MGTWAGTCDLSPVAGTAPRRNVRGVDYFDFEACARPWRAAVDRRDEPDETRVATSSVQRQVFDAAYSFSRRQRIWSCPRRPEYHRGVPAPAGFFEYPRGP